MSAAIDCSCACPDPTVTQIPGSPGEPGADGTNGANAFSVLTEDLVIPAIGAQVAAFVGDSSWMGVGQIVFLSDGTDLGHFKVIALPGSQSATLEFLGYADDSIPGATVGAGGTVSPSGTQPALSAALPNAITDNSTGTASDTIAAGVGVQILEFPHTFIGGTAAVEPVTNYVVPFTFKILSWAFVTTELLVGAAGSRVANMEIASVDVGTVPSTITIPIANAAVGTVTTGTAVAGANTGAAGGNISIEIASGGTAFTAGSGTFLVALQNLDTADALASLADHVNDLRAALA
jgi:hypothetical protein